MTENKTKNQENTASTFERLETFLFSRKFIFLVVIMGIFPLIMHSHQLFFSISPFKGSIILKNIYALFYAISFDLTILIFTIHVIKRKPILYAVFVFIINLLYYDPFSPQPLIMRFTKVFLAGVLAYTSYSYAELFVVKIAESRKSTRKRQVYKPVNRRVNNPGKQENSRFKCQECDKEFDSVKALNGHMVAHR